MNLPSGRGGKQYSSWRARRIEMKRKVTKKTRRVWEMGEREREREREREKMEGEIGLRREDEDE
jgi:hypothetical protein